MQAVEETFAKKAFFFLSAKLLRAYLLCMVEFINGLNNCATKLRALCEKKQAKRTQCMKKIITFALVMNSVSDMWMVICHL